MKLHSGRNTICFLSLVIVSFSACGRRSAETPALGNSGLGMPASQQAVSSDRSAELEKLIRDQSDALTKLSTDKATLTERAASLDTQIKTLTSDLASNKTLTDAQKAEMTKTIAALQAEKDNLNKQMKEMTDKNAALQKQLDDTRAQNATLQRQLEAARVAQQAQQASTATAPTAVKTASTTTATSFYKFRYVDAARVKNDCLDVPSGNTADGVQLISFPCNTASMNQMYVIDSPVNTFFMIKPRLSGKCITASSSLEGAAVIQKTCTNTQDQTWEFFVRGQTEYRLRNQFSGKCLKIQSDGKIIQGDCSTNSSYFTSLTAG
jgi:hypothetical protein